MRAGSGGPPPPGGGASSEGVVSLTDVIPRGPTAGDGASPPVRFVHTADWQLGMTRHFLAPPRGDGAGRADGAGRGGEAQARFAQARLDAVRALGRVADAEGAAFVVVGGDVFESNLVGPDVVARACEALRSFRTPVLLLPGNHDPADAASVLRREDFARRCPAHVSVLDRAGGTSRSISAKPALWRVVP